MSSPSRLVSAKSGLHPRNRHAARYDFRALIRTSPELAAYVQRHPVEGDTIAT